MAITREDFMKNIDFKMPRQKKSDADITLNFSHDKKRLNIYFRNMTANLLGDFVKFGVYKNRVIFEPAEMGLGFKVTKVKKKPGWGVITYTFGEENESESWEKWIGNYNLKLDEFYDYRYIQQKG